VLAVYWNPYNSGSVFLLRHDQNNEMLSIKSRKTIARDLRKGFQLFEENERNVTKRFFREGNGDENDELYKDITEVVVITWYNMRNGESGKKV